MTNIQANCTVAQPPNQNFVWAQTAAPPMVDSDWAKSQTGLIWWHPVHRRTTTTWVVFINQLSIKTLSSSSLPIISQLLTSVRGLQRNQLWSNGVISLKKSRYTATY